MTEYPVKAINLHKRFFPIRHPSMKSVLRIKDQKKSIVACDDISFSLERGKLMGVMGANGSGKTTLIRMLAGIIIPDNGRAQVNGFDVVKESLRARESMGVVFGETKNFYVRLTGEENLKLFAAFYNLSRIEASHKIEELAYLLGIGQYLDKMFQENSTGIKQRFALARGFLSDAPVLLLDEPTKHLDPFIANSVRSFIRNDLVNKKGKTILFTSHLPSEVSDIADKIAILKAGKIQALGTLEELRDNINQETADIAAIYNFYIDK